LVRFASYASTSVYIARLENNVFGNMMEEAYYNQCVSKIQTTTLNQDVKTIYRASSGTKTEIGGGGINFSALDMTGGYARDISVNYGTSSDTKTFTMLGYYGNGANLDYIYMGGEYYSAPLKITNSGDVVFRKAPKVGEQSVVTNDQLDTYLPKSTETTAYAQVYMKKADGSQGRLSISPLATEYTLAQRDVGGTLVVGTPTANNHAATKKYVDDAIADSESSSIGATNIVDGASGTNSLMQKEDAGKYTDAKPNFV
jgi:hypothetical protein